MWPDILDLLINGLNSGNEVLAEHSSFAISIIVEDCAHIFESAKYNSTLTNLISALGSLFSTSSDSLLINILSTLNTLITTSNPIMFANTEMYLEALFDFKLRSQ